MTVIESKVVLFQIICLQLDGTTSEEEITESSTCRSRLLFVDTQPDLRYMSVA